MRRSGIRKLQNGPTDTALSSATAQHDNMCNEPACVFPPSLTAL
jgi:hypothetical protein